ncbi:aminotransferase class III-fold pyridoxal phosphate-dependent enzyme [Candidatus Uhrbacteria bacterium]|nr:aminotransferase class III-fold pyridoxal phosphate-dependent enzyme [Candidatus Uhrbacteria bacterium]
MQRSTEKSKLLLARAEQVIPRAAQTLSKAPDQFVRGVSPYAIARGEGCRVWDVDGNEYIDLVSSLGAIVLGYRHPVIEEAVVRQRARGTLFSIPGDLEVELAEQIIKRIPFIESVRFGMNGSDVTTAAIRVARAFTGRDHVAKCGYHGWADWSIATHPLRSKGIPQAVKELTHEFSYNKLDTLRKIFEDHPNQVAAVILEPVSAVSPEPGFLEGVRDLAHEHGAVFIFDELVTGFRLALGGAAEYFNVTPDLVCYGKAISNGEPLSVLGGRKDLMSVLDGQDVFFSFTYAGYLPSLAASLATLEFMDAHPVQKTLWERGKQMMQGYRTLAETTGVPTSVIGLGPHPIFQFKKPDGGDDLALKSLFIQETAKQGILTNCSNLVNYSHTEGDIQEVLSRMEEVFRVMAGAVNRNAVEASLEGPMIRPRSKPAS